MIDNINWYPGHMKKTRELIQENLKMVDRRHRGDRRADPDFQQKPYYR